MKFKTPLHIVKYSIWIQTFFARGVKGAHGPLV